MRYEWGTDFFSRTILFAASNVLYFFTIAKWKIWIMQMMKETKGYYIMHPVKFVSIFYFCFIILWDRYPYRTYHSYRYPGTVHPFLLHASLSYLLVSRFLQQIKEVEFWDKNFICRGKGNHLWSTVCFTMCVSCARRGCEVMGSCYTFFPFSDWIVAFKDCSYTLSVSFCVPLGWDLTLSATFQKSYLKQQKSQRSGFVNIYWRSVNLLPYGSWPGGQFITDPSYPTWTFLWS